MKKNALFILIRETCAEKGIDAELHQSFIDRFIGNVDLLYYLFSQLYSNRDDFNTSFKEIVELIIDSYSDRTSTLKKQDQKKDTKDSWFLSNKLAGMSLYVDRFAGNLRGMSDKLNYLEELGVNVLHLLPTFS